MIHLINPIAWEDHICKSYNISKAFDLEKPQAKIILNAPIDRDRVFICTISQRTWSLFYRLWLAQLYLSPVAYHSSSPSQAVSTVGIFAQWVEWDIFTGHPLLPWPIADILFAPRTNTAGCSRPPVLETTATRIIHLTKSWSCIILLSQCLHSLIYIAINKTPGSQRPAFIGPFVVHYGWIQKITPDTPTEKSLIIHCLGQGAGVCLPCDI